MFTSRAEYRILLRQDNADLRLTPLMEKLIGDHADRAFGTAPSIAERMKKVDDKRAAAVEIERFFKETSVTPDVVNGFLESVGSAPISQKVKLHGILLRPNVDLTNLRTVLPELDSFLNQYDADYLGEAETGMKYDGYIKKEQEMADKMLRLEELKIFENFDFQTLTSISKEAREKLSKVRPRTIGQASRISGVTPADVSVLLVHMGR